MDWRKLALRILYWLAVLIVSLAVLVGLILLLESRDDSSIEGGTVIAAALTPP